MQVFSAPSVVQDIGPACFPKSAFLVIIAIDLHYAIIMGALSVFHGINMASGLGKQHVRQTLLQRCTAVHTACLNMLQVARTAERAVMTTGAH